MAHLKSVSRRKFFADTTYWIALLNKHDQYHDTAKSLDASVQGTLIVTSDMVLTEVLNSFSKWPFLKLLAANFITAIRQQPATYKIIAQSHEQFESALKSYVRFSDQQWGLTDCASRDIILNEGIQDILTADHHFQQMGFTIHLTEDT